MGSGVRGDVLRWARKQQEHTMRWVHAKGGPSPGYQSEVENGKKCEVLSEMLSSWIAVLNVSEAFARGQIGKFHDNPDACAGLAADIYALAAAGRNSAPLNEQDHVREVLRLIAYESRHVPRVVLAWVLDLDVVTLDAVIAGDHPVLQEHMKATAHLTALSEAFFTESSTDPLQQYLPAVLRAMELNVMPQQLLEMIERQAGSGSSELGA